MIFIDLMSRYIWFHKPHTFLATEDKVRLHAQWLESRNLEGVAKAVTAVTNSLNITIRTAPKKLPLLPQYTPKQRMEKRNKTKFYTRCDKIYKRVKMNIEEN
jgi:hypothetical protein